MTQVKQADPGMKVSGAVESTRTLTGSEQNAALAIAVNECRAAVGVAKAEMKAIRERYPTKSSDGVKIVLTAVQIADRREEVATVTAVRVRAVEAGCEKILALTEKYPSAHVGRRDLTQNPDDPNSIRVGGKAIVQWFRGELKAVLS